MSLDGYIADEKDDVTRLFAWMSQGDTTVDASSGDIDFDLKFSEDGAQSYEGMVSATGAIVSGRGMFDTANAWGGKHPFDVPVFVVTHDVPGKWVYEGSPFTFVTDGIESAIEQARAVAGDKNVGVGGAKITQQCLKLGLLDELGIDLVAVLLGRGVRLFDSLEITPIELEQVSVTADTGVTHITYRILK